MHIGPQLSTYRCTYLSILAKHPYLSYLNSSLYATMLCPGQWLEGKMEGKREVERSEACRGEPKSGVQRIELR